MTQCPNDSMTKSLDVCLTPALIPLYKVEDYTVVIIDIFRATSSICYGINTGLSFQLRPEMS
jgi:2-phosphosulfolactate phosphatase